MKLGDIKLQPPPESWWLQMLEATIDRRKFDKYGGDRRCYRLFREADAAAPCGYYAISDISFATS
jgi:hypothetical protein